MITINSKNNKRIDKYVDIDAYMNSYYDLQRLYWTGEISRRQYLEKFYFELDTPIKMTISYIRKVNSVIAR